MKWSNILKQFVGVFDNFVKLALKGLSPSYNQLTPVPL